MISAVRTKADFEYLINNYDRLLAVSSYSISARSGRSLTRLGDLMIERIFGATALTAILLAFGCDSEDSCVRVGTNQVENLSILSGHVERLGLPTTKIEIAYMTGTAYAASQLEGGQTCVPATVCLRLGREGDTEYRVITDKNEGSTEWLSTAEIQNR